MFKNFIFKQLLKSKMKNVPADQQAKIMAALDKNPKLFEEIASRASEKMKSGKDQMTAIMEAAKEREAELRSTLQ
jgi:hypothetical protein